jgi:ABC-type nitrate/sulfonate/bicarbonate transport system ATPase subunit
LLRVAGVSYTYPATHTHALDDVSLTVDEGEFVSVVGPSGCGKSTLVQAAAGLISGYDGTIAFRNIRHFRGALPCAMSNSALKCRECRKKPAKAGPWTCLPWSD